MYKINYKKFRKKKTETDTNINNYKSIYNNRRQLGHAWYV